MPLSLADEARSGTTVSTDHFCLAEAAFGPGYGLITLSVRAKDHLNLVDFLVLLFSIQGDILFCIEERLYDVFP